MYTRTITYTDYNDNVRTETYQFNLTKAELMEMQMSTEGGFAESVQKIVDAKDIPAIIKTFKGLLKKSYGEKSADGRRFMKEDDNGNPLWPKFAQTEAYSMLYTELATDDKAAAEFINNVIPKEMAEEIAKQEKLKASK